MLKKKNRLSKLGNFKTVKSISTPHFVIKYNKQEEEFARFGFIVSKKIDKRAVIRNRIRRRFQEAVRYSLEKIIPYSFLIVAKKESLGQDPKKLKESIKEALEDEKLTK